MFRMFRALEAEQTAQLGNFKREIHQELKDTLVAINQSISQFTGNTDKSTISTSLNNDLLMRCLWVLLIMIMMLLVLMMRLLRPLDHPSFRQGLET